MKNNTTLPNVCRVAAHAGFLTTCKYYSQFNYCEAYTTAVGKPATNMCTFSIELFLLYRSDVSRPQDTVVH